MEYQFELCICKHRYPKNDTSYYLYSTIENAIEEIKKWLQEKRIKEEDIKYLRKIIKRLDY